MRDKFPERLNMNTPPGETREEEKLEELMTKLTMEVKADLAAEELGQSVESSAS
jgi:hypothetical protein